jgi:hypothetical protein
MIGFTVHGERETSILRRAGDRASLRIITESEPAGCVRNLYSHPPSWKLASVETSGPCAARDATWCSSCAPQLRSR